MVIKFVWGITGSGDLIQESVETIEKIDNEYNVKITCIVSKEGELVLKWYKLFDKVKNIVHKFYIEKGPNQPFIAGPLQRGEYKFLYVSPASGNTVAKIVHGIADTLITNCVAQTIKGYVPVYIYPVDQHKGDIITILPNGKKLKLRMRTVDLNNVKKLRQMDGITVLNHPNEIIQIINEL